MSKNSNSFMPVILTLSLGTLVGCMNMSLFNVAISQLLIIFQTTVSTAQWLTSGYMLAAGIITPAVAFLGSRFSYKKTLLTTTVLTMLLSVLACLFHTMEALIIVRILIGLTAGILMPLTMGMVYQIVPPREQGSAAAIWGTANLVGGVLPVLLSGLIITYLSWQFLFLLNVPFAALLALCILKFIPQDSTQDNQKLNALDFTTTALGSFVLLFALSNLSSWGFGLKFSVMLVAGLLLLTFYIVRNWQKDDAMLNLSVLKYPRYVAALLADSLNIIALYMMTFLMPLFLQRGLGISAAIAGLFFLPGTLFSAGAMPIATKILNYGGEKLLALVGVCIIVIGSIPLFRPWSGIPLLLVLAVMCIRNFGIGFMNLLSTNASMSAVPIELSGHASSLTNWMRQMVGALATSMCSNIIAMRLATAHATTTEEISAVYVSSTGIIMLFTCLLLLIIIPIGMKFFRGKTDMQNL